MRRELLFSMLWLLGGCRATTPSASPPSSASPLSPVTAQDPIAVTVVEQELFYTMPSGFDPTGRIVLDRCSAWSEGGVYLGELPEEQCARWSDADVRQSPRSQTLARRDGATVVLEGEGTSAHLQCDGCGPVAGLAWSSDGTRIALVREEGQDVEIWSVAEKRTLRTVSLGNPGRLTAAQLAWPGSLYLLLSVADERPLCEDLEDLEDPNEATEEDDCIGGEEASVLSETPTAFSLVTYQSLDAPPEHETLGIVTDGESHSWGGPELEYDAVGEAYLDPGARCLYFVEEDGGTRESLGSRFTAEGLEGDCAFGDDDDTYEQESQFELARWVEGPRTRLVSVVYTSEGDEEDGDYSASEEFELLEIDSQRRQSWTETLPVVTPEGFPSDDEDDAREYEEFSASSEDELVSIGVHDDALAIDWRECFEGDATTVGSDDEDAEWIRESWCESSWDEPDDCDVLELAPSRPYTLASCGPDRALTLLGKAEERIDLEVTHPAARDEQPQWIWGENWLVVVDGATGVTWRSLVQPTVGQRLDAAEAWVPTTLGPAHDRLVLHHGDGLQLIDATSGREAERLESRLEGAIHAALSPSGRMFAVTDGAQIEVIALTGDSPSTVWPAPGTAVVAWRQDETAVYSGPDAVHPTRVWDARRGVELPDAIPESGDEATDPSWRWQLVTPHRVRRLCDGLEIWFDEEGVLLDDGRFEGDPAALQGIMYRLGDEQVRSSMVDPSVMRSVMERKGLAEDFFAGRPIEAGPVTVTPEQRDTLLGS